MYIFCEVPTALGKAIAIKLKGGMSQQRLKNPYTSWTVLAFGIQAKLVKAVLRYFWPVILTSAS